MARRPALAEIPEASRCFGGGRAPWRAGLAGAGATPSETRRPRVSAAPWRSCGPEVGRHVASPVHAERYGLSHALAPT